jgi:hypothetical protein
MKRLLVLFAVLVPLSLVIAGCGGSGSSGPSTKTSKEQIEKMTKSQMEFMQKSKGPGAAPAAKK